MNPMDRTTSEIFLHPGQTFFGECGFHIGTLLGSCVAICIWHPMQRIGGMCHYVLPTNSADSHHQLNGRYGSDAIQILEHEAKLRGTRLPEYHGSIFGGGDVVEALSGTQRPSIGSQNAGFAMEILLYKNVPVLVADVGEKWSRRISMDLSTGLVAVKRQGSIPLAV